MAIEIPIGGHHRDVELLLGQIHSFLTMPRIYNKPMLGDLKTDRHGAVPASAVDDSLSAARSLPPAAVAAGARDISPGAHDDSEFGVFYSGESDVSVSGKAPEAAPSPAVPRPLNILLNERTSDLHHSPFGSDDEYNNGYDYSSPRSGRASSSRALTMARVVVTLTTVVPSKVPRRSVMI